MEMNMAHPAPICATVSRKTGEVRIEWADDLEMQIRFGKIMNRLNRIAEAWMDRDAKAEAEALEARRQDDEMKGCENAPTRITAGCATR